MFRHIIIPTLYFCGQLGGVHSILYHHENYSWRENSCTNHGLCSIGFGILDSRLKTKVWNIKLMLFNCRIIFLPEPAQQFWGHGCPVPQLQQGVQHVPLLRLPRHLALPLCCRDVLLLHAAAHSGRGTHGPGHSVHSHFLVQIKCMLLITIIS